MQTYKNDLDLFKEQTINKYVLKFKAMISKWDTDSDVFQNAFIANDVDGKFAFDFLGHSILQLYKINPFKKTASIKTYEVIIDHNNYPNQILRCIADIKIKFSTIKNDNGFYNCLINGKPYCLENNCPELITDIANKLKNYIENGNGDVL
ncbi:MAG TPA: hypothetical protein VNG53_02460 [Bacteroidia bacterium]|nr:hypothetical protein [Bacteroidia bacterium]